MSHVCVFDVYQIDYIRHRAKTLVQNTKLVSAQ